MFTQQFENFKDVIKSALVSLSQEPVPRSLDKFLKALSKEDLENRNIEELIGSVHLAMSFPLQRRYHMETIETLAAAIREEKPHLTNAVNQLTETINSSYGSRSSGTKRRG